MKSVLEIFDNNMKWIINNTLNKCGIATTSIEQVVYPEVTGYYIPTLINWGERDLAILYARYLCQIQKEDGSWYDSRDQEPYIFDSAQILKGLLAVRTILPEVDNNIIRGCNWLISTINEQGQMVTPSKDAWGNDNDFCSELIHLYCLTPLVEASNVYGVKEFKISAEKVLDYYKSNYMQEIENFSLLSHFYAYVMEGLLDLGEVDIVKKAMMNLEKYQNRKGGIPGLNNVKWVCSTGLFQLALVWYKLGDLVRGNRIFDYACTLQNNSGGWYGSYPASWLNKFSKGKKKPYYFPTAEISWCNKYFLDALSWKSKQEFELQADSFLDYIDKTDGRYMAIKNEIVEKTKNETYIIDVLDIGCGKGRYIKNLVEDTQNAKYFAVDLSETVMKEIPKLIEKKQGTLTCVPYPNETFDIVYTCEALEHAISIEGALRELIRVVKKGGKVLIIDKTIDMLGELKIEPWEQWINDHKIVEVAQNYNCKIEINNNVQYENKRDGLFHMWTIIKEV